MLSKLFWFISFFTISALAYSDSVNSSSIIATFRQYKLLNAKFTASVGTSVEIENRREVEAFMDGSLSQALGDASKAYCSSENRSLVEELIALMLATKNSASEEPSSALGKMYICKPEIVLAVFQSRPDMEQREIYELLKFGFENEAYKDSEKHLAELRSRLEALNPEGRK